LKPIIVLSAVGYKTNIENIGSRRKIVGICNGRDKNLSKRLLPKNQFPGYFATVMLHRDKPSHVASAEVFLCEKR